MSSTIKARYSNGVLKPLEKVNLREGEEVSLTIAALPPSAQPGWLERTAAGWSGLVDAEELKREIYQSRLLATRPEPRL